MRRPLSRRKVGALKDLLNAPAVGETIILQKCKHRWLNGLEATIVEIRGADLVVKSEEGRHVIGSKNIAERKKA